MNSTHLRDITAVVLSALSALCALDALCLHA